MLLTFLPVLLILKHFLIANILDIGYSNARDVRNRRWVWDTALWTLLELTASYHLYHWTGVKEKYWVLLELAMCLASVNYERRALPGWELRTYFFWESMFFCLYVLIGVIT